MTLEDLHVGARVIFADYFGSVHDGLVRDVTRSWVKFSWGPRDGTVYPACAYGIACVRAWIVEGSLILADTGVL